MMPTNGLVFYERGGKIDVTNNKCKPSINTQTEESITLNRILHNDDDDYSKGILRQYFQLDEDYSLVLLY